MSECALYDIIKMRAGIFSESALYDVSMMGDSICLNVL